jgi:hypothetical protein
MHWALFVRKLPSDQPQRQRQAGLGGQHRMAGNEDEAQQIVSDVAPASRLDCGMGFSLARSLYELFGVLLDDLIECSEPDEWSSIHPALTHATD